MMLPVFLGSVDQSVLASALPTIGRDLGDVHNLPWLITAFLIASTALTPLYGKFADIHGRRAAMLVGITVYMVGSLISAASRDMLMLIGGRVVQGCGAAGLIVTANMVLGDIATPKERGRYYTYFSLAFMTAGGSGPALGGWIAEHLRWPVIFLWNFPLCVIALAIALTVLRRLPRRERQHRLDVIGATLVIAASSSFMLALNLGGIRYPWLSTPIVALLVCALVLGAGFVVRLRTAIEPLIPIAILADPGRSGRPADHRRALVRLGRDHESQRLPADVFAERIGLVADFGRIEPHHSDADAQFDRGFVEPTPWPGPALQAFAAVFFVRRAWRRCRAGSLGRQYDVVPFSRSSCC